MGRWLYVASGLLAICATLLFPPPSAIDMLASYVTLPHENSTLGIVAEPAASTPWNQLYHLGGNSPWIPKVSGLVSPNISVPDGCRVDQVHMMSRHAERWPTTKVGERMRALIRRLAWYDPEMNGSLSFAGMYRESLVDQSEDFDNLVPTGPYAGTLEAFATGVRLRTRYDELLYDNMFRKNATLWASGSTRVEETARYFGTGFFGVSRERQSYGHLKVIPETPERAADTLTPGNTCLNYANDADEYGHGYGARVLAEFQSTYLPAIVGRFAQENPGIPFTADEVYTMQEMCGFGIITKGSSPWCNAFTREEWESFEYARDLLHYYRSGPGNPYGATMGWLWLNATANLIQSHDTRRNPFYFSFVHDGDIIRMLTALNLFPQSNDLPTTHVLHNRTWRTSDITPMGGRVILERLACSPRQYCFNNPLYGGIISCEVQRPDKHFVRVNVNDGIVAIPGCENGPGHSCPVDDFAEIVKKRGEEVGEFGKVCGLADNAAKEITFLHQPDR